MIALTRTILVVLFPLAFSVSGCGGESADPDAPFAGRWSGTVVSALQGLDLQVTANMRSVVGAKDIYMGDISTDVPRCFTSALVSALVSNNSIMLAASGSGSATQSCSIFITGVAADGKVTGLFRMSSDLSDDCNVEPPVPFTFVRQ